MVPGTFGHGTALPTPSSVADTNTVVGAFITVPLSVNSSKNCDEFYDVQRSRAKLKLAKELHEAGQITDTEFSAISKEAYASLKWLSDNKLLDIQRFLGENVIIERNQDE